MCGGAVGGFTNEEVGFLTRNLGGDEMPVVFARVVAGEHDFEAGDLDEEHGTTEDMASVIGCDGDTSMGEGGVVVDGLNARVGGKMVRFGVESFGSVVDVAAGICILSALWMDHLTGCNAMVCT